MHPRDVLRELEALAGRLGIPIRAESFDLRVMAGAGGLCWLRGRPVIVVDAGAPLMDRVAVVASALAEFDLETLYISPLLRARIARERSTRLRLAANG